jgi:helicase MOV-10
MLTARVVAVTRAQALLIVVGDPDVLGLDPLWRAFLNYVRIHGGWTGPAMSWDPREDVRDGMDYARETRERGMADMNALARRMEALALDGAGVDADTDADANGEAVEATVDRPWQEAE